VTITRKDNEKVTGTFVWADPKNNRLFIRPKAGQAPVAVATNDVDKIERIAPAVGTTGKGTVRPAIEGDGPSPSYEITTMRVHNGPYTTQFFFDDSLSPAEREQLRAMEKASNDVAQKGMEIESLSKAIQNANEQPATTVVSTGGGYGYAASPYVVPYPFVYPVAYGLYSPLPPGMNFGGNYLYYYGGIPTNYMAAYPTGNNTTVVTQNSGDNAKTLAALTKSLGEARTALADAQKRNTAMANRAVYDPSGRIVAVRLEQ